MAADDIGDLGQWLFCLLMTQIQKNPWFIEERSIAFASLALTKREDVVVRAHADADMAIDMLVEVLKNGKSGLRFFGVQLVASMDLPPVEEADERLLSSLPSESIECTLPLCAFLIGVRRPEGMYRWSVEPVVEGGRPILDRDSDSSWQALDEAGVAHLVDKVNSWYDVLEGGSTANSHGGNSTKRTR